MSNFCKQCGIKVKDATATCPLCHNVLDAAEGGEHTYPDIPEKLKKLTVLKRFALFLGIMVCVLCLFVDYKLSRRPDWSVLVIVTIVYVLSLLYVLLDPESGYRKRIILILFGGMMLFLMIDILTGSHGWSLNFVLPGVIFFFNIGLLVIMFINRRNWQSYMLYQIGVIFVGIVPLVLISMGIITYPLISELAFLSSVFVFLGTLIFGGRVARTELQRRFHI